RSSLLAALVICPAPRSTLFPYTTLFRSVLIHATSTKTRWKSVRGNVRGNGINGRYVHRAGREGRPDELLRYSLVPDGHRTHHQGRHRIHHQASRQLVGRPSRLRPLAAEAVPLS